MENNDRRILAPYYEYWGAARSPLTPPETLRELAGTGDEFLRQRIATNIEAPHNLLAELTEDGRHGVRRGVALNPSTPPDLLTNLAEDEHPQVRDFLACNTTASSDLLARVARYSISRDGITCAAANPNTPPDVLRELAGGPSSLHVAGNPSTPPDVLRELAKSESWITRWGVMENRSTPRDILDKLVDDENGYVRWGRNDRRPNYHPSITIADFNDTRHLSYTTNDGREVIYRFC